MASNIEVHENPARGVAEALVAPDFVLLKFRICFFPHQIVWRRAVIIERTDRIVNLIFPDFVAHGAIRIYGMGLINQRRKLITSSLFSTPMPMVAGDFLNLSYAIRNEMCPTILPVADDMMELRRRRRELVEW